jgi:CheY-like chemotaxis protein
MVTGTVLIVDDDPVAREWLHGTLVPHGYCVAQANSGNEALIYLKFHAPPSLILLDMLTPGMDGWRFLDVFRQTLAWSSIPVLITTGVSVANSEWAASLGAAGLLKKPFDEGELMHAVWELG